MTDNTDFYAALRERIGPTRHCNACGTTHPIEDFPIKNRELLRVHGKCKAAQRSASSADYAANRDRRKAKTAEYRARVRSEVKDIVDHWLAGRVCVRCAKPGKHLIAVGADGVNLRRLVAQGFTPDDIRPLLDGATPECWGCRSNP